MAAQEQQQQEPSAERQRLERQRTGEENWQLWGPYLAERAWGTVREDYSPHGGAWEYFDHEQSHYRAYRWSEDGLGGVCDEQQRLCFALSLWNGRDPWLKERAFGLTGKQGNRGEDVKEFYFFRDATPSHSFLRYLYKYPQREYPYAELIRRNAERSRTDPPYNLLDSGVFDDGAYWDVDVVYAKASIDEIHIHIHAYNRGRQRATLHLLPTLWFRNTWSWGEDTERPALVALQDPPNAAWAVLAEHPTLGAYHLYGAQPAELLFTENATNAQRAWGDVAGERYSKDAFHRRVIDAEEAAVNPAKTGTKVAPWYRFDVEAGSHVRLDFVLSANPLDEPFARANRVFSERQSEATVFFDELLPEASPEDHRIMRQALSGMIWSKQYFNYDVSRWLAGDQLPPPPQRKAPTARNRQWLHLQAADIISMPDTWEYPWFAAWDLAYHCAALALVDVDFAKRQIELMVSDRYLHPSGQIPAYEWNFGDTNPPVHAMGALKVFRAERVQRGRGDVGFLQRVFHKLLLNFAWWINRKDSNGHNLFEGGFLGLDNISPLNRSELHLPRGWMLKQADATGWMAMFSLNMTVMALELAREGLDYEDIAIQCYKQFLAIADAIQGEGEHGISLWNDDAGFFMDLLVHWHDGVPAEKRYMEAYSWVGLIPLFAVEVVPPELLERVPRFLRLLEEHKHGVMRGHTVCICPSLHNARGERILALVDEDKLAAIVNRLLNESEFLSRYGVRSVSRLHGEQQEACALPGGGTATIEYNPGESDLPLFGGNSNWRGPVWLPTNYSLIQALEKYHRFLGPDYRISVAARDGEPLTLREIATLLAERLVDLYRRDPDGVIPGLRRDSPFQSDEHWKDLFLFYEYFHAETGQGLGAAHQTGWTGLLANLVMRRYQKDITPWSRLQSGEPSSTIDEIA